MEQEIRFCKSCGMPLTKDILGTNANGSRKDIIAPMIGCDASHPSFLLF